MAQQKDPLIEAIQDRNLNNVIKLLRGVDIDILAVGNNTPLICAAGGQKIAVVSLLLEKGANVNATNGVGSSPVHALCSGPAGDAQLEILDILISAGADILKKNSDGNTALHVAASCGNVNLVTRFFNLGVGIETRGFRNRTPLMFAVRHGSIDAVRLLINRGALVTAADEDRYTALHFVGNTPSHSPVSAIIELLLESGANIEARAHVGTAGASSTPLLRNINNKEAVSTFIAAGADLEATELRSGCTALLHAAAHSAIDSAKLLVAAGANAMAVDNDGDTVLHYIAMRPYGRNFNEWMKLILNAGAAESLVNCKNENEETPLQTLVDSFYFDLKSDIRILDLFLKAGADATGFDADRRGLLHILITSFVNCFPDIDEFDGDEFKERCEAAGQLIQRSAEAGAKAAKDMDGYTPMQTLKKLVNEFEGRDFDGHRNAFAPILVALLAAGDYSWDLMPRNEPLPGLGAALLSVWRNKRDEVPYLLSRLSSEDKERMRMAVSCLHFGSKYQGRGRNMKREKRALPEELRLQIISYMLAA